MMIPVSNAGVQLNRQVGGGRKSDARLLYLYAVCDPSEVLQASVN